MNIQALSTSQSLQSIMLRLSEHGATEARKLLRLQWGFLAPGEHAIADAAIADAAKTQKELRAQERLENADWVKKHISQEYEIKGRLPMSNGARNVGATGREFWWHLLGRVFAKNKHAACAKFRKTGRAEAADKLRAYIC